jgi:hypothetical protein
MHLTPPVFDPVPLKGKTLPAGLQEYRQPYEGYDDVLARYSDWLLGQRGSGWDVIDVHGPMKEFLAQRRQKDPGYSLAGDGVHANATGHFIIAEQILRRWGIAEGLMAIREDKALLTLVRERQRLLTDAWLNEIGHLRPGMPRGLSIPEVTTKAAELMTTLRKQAKINGAAEKSGKAADKSGLR